MLVYVSPTQFGGSAPFRTEFAPSRNPSDDLEFKQVHNAGPLPPRVVVATTGIFFGMGLAVIQERNEANFASFRSFLVSKMLPPSAWADSRVGCCRDTVVAGAQSCFAPPLSLLSSLNSF